MARPDQTPSSPEAPAAVWAAFLACSWTWCIGMFLAVVLLRDFGIWGFLVLAVPIVVGAAALGWVVPSRERALSLLARHRLAIACFSSVTIAFHVYWLAWIGSWAPGALGLGRPIVAGVLAVAGLGLFLFNTVSRRALVAAAVPLWILSAVLLSQTVLPGRVGPSAPPAADERGLLWLAPVMIFGFALCPYLVGTFLTARAALAPGRAKAAFGLGFGVLFLAMIVGTVLYAPLLDPTLGGAVAAPWIGAALLVHMLLQAAYTVSVHRRMSTLSALHPAGLCALLLVAAFGAVLASGPVFHAGLTAGEVGYRAFLGFYGLIFPAYVWLVMIPGRAPVAAGRRIRVFAGAVGIALPMYWMGFIERQEFFLAPGLLVVLLARLLVRGPATGS
jgi:hypothetical protein